jgi:uncharacterized pyridoxal phosphate-containing UPF0001 family protein
MPNIENNITAVQRRLQQAARDAGRNPGDILLLAVSKTRSSAQVSLAQSAGIHSFGENYLQEASDKITQLGDQGLDWHFIGPLQSNKTRQVGRAICLGAYGGPPQDSPAASVPSARQPCQH